MAEPTAARVSFTINAPSTNEALIALAVQSGISIGGGAACHGHQTRLVGAFTIAEGLNRLLAGSGCRFEFVDAKTVRVVGAPPVPATQAKREATPAPTLPIPAAASAAVGELVVTATKRPGFTGETAGALEVIGGNQIDATELTDTEGVSRQAASFTTTNLGPTRNKILLRGLSDGAFTGRTQSTVGTYLDDAPVTYNAPDPDLRLADVASVQILRGPQGALYGGGSLSGVYRIVTRKPQFDEVTAEGSALAATTEGGAPSTQVDFVFNAPLIANEAAARIVLYDDRDGGYLQDDNLRLSNVDLTQRAGGRAAVRWLMGDHWTGTLSTAVQRLASSDTQYTTAAIGRNRRSNQVRETHHNNFLQGAFALSGSGDWGKLESSTAFVHHDYASLYDASAVLTAFGADPADDVGLFDEGAAIRLLTQDVYWSSPEMGRLHLLAGLFGSTTVEDSPSSLGSKPLNGVLRELYTERRRDSIAEGAAYGEASYDLGHGWTATAGGRLFHTDVHTTSMVRPQSGVIRNLDKSHAYGGLSPKFAVQKRWQNGNSIYVLTSAGYRAGGFNTGGLSAPAASVATFDPDRLQNYEAGGEFSLLGGRINVHTAVFFDHWDNIQTDQYFPSGLSYTANVGDGRNIGWEVEIAYQISTNLKIQANSLWDRPQVTSLNPGFTGIVGAQLPGVPNDAFSGIVTYNRPLKTYGLHFIATAEAAYTGQSRLTFDSRFSPVTPDYYTAKLSAQLAWPKSRLALLVSNPLNTSKDTFSYGNPFSFGQVRQVTPQRPRTVSLMLAKAY